MNVLLLWQPILSRWSCTLRCSPLRVHSFSSCTLCHFALQTTAPEVPVTVLLCHLIKENVTSKASAIPAPQTAGAVLAEESSLQMCPIIFSLVILVQVAFLNWCVLIKQHPLWCFFKHNLKHLRYHLAAMERQLYTETK